MKRILVLSIALLMTPCVAHAWQADLKTRTWTDVSGNHTVEARLVEYDAAAGKVILEKPDGEQVEVGYDQLVISDRRFLSRHAARQQRARRAEQRQAEVRDGTREVFGKARQREPAGGQRDVQRLYNINWHQTPASAKQAALGGERVSDDKPVIWFRVLGDLSGLM